MSKADTKTMSVKKFLLKIIIWLPLTFVTWYFVTPAIVYVVGLLSKSVLMLFASHAISNIEPQGHTLEIITNFSSGKGKEGVLTFTVNAMKYGYGIALFLAMLLASPDKLSSKIQNFYIGVIVLIIIQVWGVTFDILLTLVFKLGRSIGETMGTTEFTREVIALCYQIGYLILPAIAPVLLWFTMYQKEVIKMAPKFAQVNKRKN